jgi:hypothetical protein
VFEGVVDEVEVSLNACTVFEDMADDLHQDLIAVLFYYACLHFPTLYL